MPSRLLLAISIFALLLTLSRWFTTRLNSKWLQKTRMERGAREALVTFSSYTILALAILFALSIAGNASQAEYLALPNFKAYTTQSREAFVVLCMEILDLKNSFPGLLWFFINMENDITSHHLPGKFCARYACRF